MSSRRPNIIARFAIDGIDAVGRGLRRLETSIRDAASRAGRATTDLARRAGTAIRREFANAASESVRQATKRIEQATAGLKKLAVVTKNVGFTAMEKSAKAAFIGIGAAATIAGAKIAAAMAITSSTANDLSKMDLTNRQTGVSVQDQTTLRGIAGMQGTDPDSLLGSLQNVTSTVRELERNSKMSQEAQNRARGFLKIGLPFASRTGDADSLGQLIEQSRSAGMADVKNVEYRMQRLEAVIRSTQRGRIANDLGNRYIRNGADTEGIARFRQAQAEILLPLVTQFQQLSEASKALRESMGPAGRALEDLKDVGLDADVALGGGVDALAEIAEAIQKFSPDRQAELVRGLFGDTTHLEFVCVPPREDLVLRAAANELRTPEVDYDPDAPAADRLEADSYDPAFFSPDAAEDPATAILARPEFFRFDPITLAVERVSITEGRVIHDVPRGGLASGGISLQVQNPPKPVTRLRLVCNFQQYARGRETFNKTGSLTTFSFDDILSQIPNKGDPIGSDTGWTFDSFDVTGITRAALPLRVQANSSNFGDAAGSYLNLRARTIDYSFRGFHDYEQGRQEILDIAMPLALEREIDDQRIEDVETLEIGEIHVDHVTRFWEYEDPDTLIRRHYVVGDFVQHNNKRYRCLVEHDATTTFSVRWGDPTVAYWIRVQKMAPQRDRRAAGYFSSGRGRRSVRYGVLRLKRIVLLRARCTELSFAIPYKAARGMSCADAIRIEVPRVGEVVGKIVSIERTIQRGEVLAHIRIASTNGDGSVPPAPIEGQEQTAELAYSILFGRLREPVNASTLATSGPFAWTVENDADTQAGLVRLAEGSGLDPMSAINKNPTRLIIAYPPLIEEDTLTRRISVTTEALRVPKQISFLPGE